MAGLYTEGESKILSGVYSLILAISTSITSGGRGIVAYPFTADWGPVNELTAGNLRELRDNYNAVGSSLSVGKIYTHGYFFRYVFFHSFYGRNSKRRERVRFRATECRFYRRQYG